MNTALLLALHKRLSPLLPAEGDTREHTFIKDITAALTINFAQNDDSMLQIVVSELKELSTSCSQWTSKLQSQLDKLATKSCDNVSYMQEPLFAEPVCHHDLGICTCGLLSRFQADPGKCAQRHAREMHSEDATRTQLSSLNGAQVVAITKEKAKPIILRYEWLKTMPRLTHACYGLMLNGELLGVVCFSRLNGGGVGRLCIAKKEDGTEDDKQTQEWSQKAVCLARGACVPWAPKNAASFLIRHACRLAHQEHGWCIFFAYSDPDAGEIGTVYQAVGWHYLGVGESVHSVYISPDGRRRLSSHTINHGRDRLMRKMGHPMDGTPFREWLVQKKSWKRYKQLPKSKYVWFEGKDRERLKLFCRHPFKPYPKRIP